LRRRDLSRRIVSKEFAGNAFIPEPAGNLVKRFILEEKDGQYTARNAYKETEFLTSTDERFRPVNAYTGPMARCISRTCIEGSSSTRASSPTI
jgi:hypothetical protein